MALGPETPFLEPDNFLYGRVPPGEIKSRNKVQAIKVSRPTCSTQQRRTMKTAQRREIIYEAPSTTSPGSSTSSGLSSGVYVAHLGRALAELRARPSDTTTAAGCWPPRLIGKSARPQQTPAIDQPGVRRCPRRDLLELGGTALAAGHRRRPARSQQPTLAQTPSAAALQAALDGSWRRCRSIPTQTITFSTMIPLSFTAYSRLVKVRAAQQWCRGPSRWGTTSQSPGSRQSDAVYVFKLKKGVHWHNKAPVDGHELTAEDVEYRYERFLTIKGDPDETVLGIVDKVEAPDECTVKFTLSEPNASFIDRLASTAAWIVARVCVEQFRRPGRGPRACMAPGPGCSSATEPNVPHVI